MESTKPAATGCVPWLPSKKTDAPRSLGGSDNPPRRRNTGRCRTTGQKRRIRPARSEAPAASRAIATPAGVVALREIARKKRWCSAVRPLARSCAQGTRPSAAFYPSSVHVPTKKHGTGHLRLYRHGPMGGTRRIPCRPLVRSAHGRRCVPRSPGAVHGPPGFWPVLQLPQLRRGSAAV